MSRWYVVGLVVLLVACSQESDIESRGVDRVDDRLRPPVLGPFDFEQSAALFVGVREFAAAPSLIGVRYTVDDAVDLAYTFALERNVHLVNPRRVALALTGEPRKAESQDRLKKLRASGVVVNTTATGNAILTLVERQARLAGRDGLLILGFASHGFSHEGTPYVLASTSRYEDIESSIAASKVLDMASLSKAQRSLILIDACRERVPGIRGPRKPPPLVSYMAGHTGQVVFYAAAPGNYAYEDERARNGVFTRAIIDGLLGCNPRTVQGVVTVEKLSVFVEERVLAWIRRNRDRSVQKATQASMDAFNKAMPLASCLPPPPPIGVKFSGKSLMAMGTGARLLWQRTLESLITHAEVADIDDDKIEEVLAVMGSKLAAFDALDNDLWSVDTSAPIRRLIVEHLYSARRKRQIIAVSESAISIFHHDGTPLGEYTFTGHVLEVRIDRPTSHHDWKIIVSTSGGRVSLLNPDKGTVWSGTVASGAVTKLNVVDFDNDRERDIELTTPTGRVYLDFAGKVIKANGDGFQLGRL